MGPGSLLLWLVALLSTSAKYVYIKQAMNWLEAQKYCREFHTDLATISNKEDKDLAQHIIGSDKESIWIGLLRDSTNVQKWIWSGGGEVSEFFWDAKQPDSEKQQCGAMRNSKWYDESGTSSYTFLCSAVIVVKEENTWEKALDYCKKKHRDMASVTSEAELMLIQKELSKCATTDYVWIGLQFLAGDWTWVNGRSMTYESWGQHGKPWCPDVKLQCGALWVSELMGVISNQGLFTPPPPSKTTTTTSRYTVTLAPLTTTSTGGSQPDPRYVKEWNAQDCEQKFYFICY